VKSEKEIDMRKKWIGFTLGVLSLCLILPSILVPQNKPRRPTAANKKFEELNLDMGIKKIPAKEQKDGRVIINFQKISQALKNAGFGPDINAFLYHRDQKLHALPNFNRPLAITNPEIIEKLRAKDKLKLVFINKRGKKLGEITGVIFDWVENIFYGILELTKIEVLFPQGMKRVAFDFHITNTGTAACGKSDSGIGHRVYMLNYSLTVTYKDYKFENKNQFSFLKVGPCHQVNVEFPDPYISIDELNTLAPGQTHVLRYFPPNCFSIKGSVIPYKAEGAILAEIRYFPSPSVRGTISPQVGETFDFYPTL
jgi:hypothetical protein